MTAKSRIFKRAWSAFSTKMKKFKSGKLINRPKFSESLKWSWKIERENKFTVRHWSPRENFHRFYFDEGRYVQVSVTTRAPAGYYERHRASKGENFGTGYYKLVNVTLDEMNKAKFFIMLKSGITNLQESKF